MNICTLTETYLFYGIIYINHNLYYCLQRVLKYVREARGSPSSASFMLR